MAPRKMTLIAAELDKVEDSYAEALRAYEVARAAAKALKVRRNALLLEQRKEEKRAQLQGELAALDQVAHAEGPATMDGAAKEG